MKKKGKKVPGRTQNKKRLNPFFLPRFCPKSLKFFTGMFGTNFKFVFSNQKIKQTKLSQKGVFFSIFH